MANPRLTSDGVTELTKRLVAYHESKDLPRNGFTDDRSIALMGLEHILSKKTKTSPNSEKLDRHSISNLLSPHTAISVTGWKKDYISQIQNALASSDPLNVLPLNFFDNETYATQHADGKQQGLTCNPPTFVGAVDWLDKYCLLLSTCTPALNSEYEHWKLECLKATAEFSAFARQADLLREFLKSARDQDEIELDLNSRTKIATMAIQKSQKSILAISILNDDGLMDNAEYFEANIKKSKSSNRPFKFRRIYIYQGTVKNLIGGKGDKRELLKTRLRSQRDAGIDLQVVCHSDFSKMHRAPDYNLNTLIVDNKLMTRSFKEDPNQSGQAVLNTASIDNNTRLLDALWNFVEKTKINRLQCLLTDSKKTNSK